MPPVKSYLRQAYNTNVADLTSGHSHHDVGPKKIHDVRLKTKLQNNLKPSSGKTNNGAPYKEKDQAKEADRNYMELNEFLLAVDDKDDLSKSDTESDPDFPKPTVDLLASLLTLGKMIQNQKQLIQNQLDHQNTTSFSLKDDFVGGSSIAEQSHIIDPTPMVDPSPMVNPSLIADQSLIVDQDRFEYDSNKQTQSQSRTVSDHGTSELNSAKEENFLNFDTSTLSKRKVIPEDIKDKDYWNRRKRNNLAAKKSREERRKKELEILETTKQLENENSQLTSILKRLSSRNEWLESRLVDIRSCKRTDESVSSSLSSSPEEN